MRQPSTRRRFLQCTALAGLTAVAGCTSTDETAQAAGATPDSETTAAPSTTETATPTPEQTPPESVSEWLTDANGYDGERRRYGIRARPTIGVGHPTDDGLAFTHPVIEVPPMTTVAWEWTGHGGQHNVVALDGTFDSGRTNAQDGTCYKYFFEKTGVYPYVSEPHREDGMKGAVFVREPPSTGYEAVDEWLAASGSFDGTVTDHDGSGPATVTVGAEGNGGHFAFSPTVLRISPGTTVRWNWTGEGGAHNVVFEDHDIRSGQVDHEPSTTFEHTFESDGIYRYACAPHRALGQRGAIIVE
ncbi:halocyanin domain-containing protein [Halomicroarcula sp. GCM10025709]|uniref:halocyanin domain-containing protein n=1 Tax=Haloarcula TaxID=2237 RepID=UPI0024C465EF|nr:halocyanin domain-containing protein [Halomicroarcula sp. YJ-61-S]